MQCIVTVRSFLMLLKLHKLAVGKLDLSGGGLTQCHVVLDHGLNLHWNIPLTLFFFNTAYTINSQILSVRKIFDST